MNFKLNDMEKKAYILIYDRTRERTGKSLCCTILGVYLLSKEEMLALDLRIAIAFSKKNSTRTDGLVEYTFFKETDITPLEQAEDAIKEAFEEQSIKIKF